MVRITATFADMIYCNEEYDPAGMNAQELWAMISNANVSLHLRDKAMYYLLNERLRSYLKRRFNPYDCKLEDSFEDVLMDFFLELRGSDAAPYKKLLSITKPSSFEGWLVISFRNFASKRASHSLRQIKSPVRMDASELKNVEQVPLDRLISMLSTLVAYCCQEFNPINRVIFLRMALTILDKGRAMPDRDVAAALGITDVYYRVTSCRLRCKVRKIKEMLLMGVKLPLAAESKRLADELNEDFSGWYQKISAFYEATLASLPQFETVIALRRERESEESGQLHDSVAVRYGYTTTDARTLWYGLGEICASINI